MRCRPSRPSSSIADRAPGPDLIRVLIPDRIQGQIQAPIQAQVRTQDPHRTPDRIPVLVPGSRLRPLET